MLSGLAATPEGRWEKAIRNIFSKAFGEIACFADEFACRDESGGTLPQAPNIHRTVRFSRVPLALSISADAFLIHACASYTCLRSLGKLLRYCPAHYRFRSSVLTCRLRHPRQCVFASKLSELGMMRQSADLFRILYKNEAALLIWVRLIKS